MPPEPRPRARTTDCTVSSLLLVSQRAHLLACLPPAGVERRIELRRGVESASEGLEGGFGDVVVVGTGLVGQQHAGSSCCLQRLVCAAPRRARRVQHGKLVVVIGVHGHADQCVCGESMSEADGAP